MIRTGAQVHMISHITVHFYCSRAANGVPKESLSHNAVQAAAADPGSIRSYRDIQGPWRFLQAPQIDLEGYKAALRAEKSAKACAGTGNKGRVGPFSHFTTVNDFKEQEQYCGHFLLILLGPAGPSSQDSHRSIAPMPV